MPLIHALLAEKPMILRYQRKNGSRSCAAAGIGRSFWLTVYIACCVVSPATASGRARPLGPTSLVVYDLFTLYLRG
jgi:hypothetical protein